MISNEMIQQCSSILHQVYSVADVYLFGSYAWGIPCESSDLDFLVVVQESDQPYLLRPQAAQRALYEANISIPTDVIVTTRAAFEERALRKTNLYSRIKYEGIKL